MDIFENEVNLNLFKKTNDIWNKLGLNSPWNVGVVSQLIKNKEFKNKEDWYDYYFESGEKRLEILKSLKEEDQVLLTKVKMKGVKTDLSYINYEYGRTKKEIMNLGKIMYECIMAQENKLNITLAECQYIAFFRTVCETWNGVKIRETETKKNIENYFLDKNIYISLINVSGKFDAKYAVDYEVYYDGSIVCGLQIKPESYIDQKTSYIYKSHKINVSKNENYNKKYNREVLYVYSTQEGIVINKDVLDSLEKIVQAN